MIPLIEWYRAFPDEIFVLEIAMGAITGQMANVDAATGAPSMMFHAVPHMLEFDPHSGDFGLGFFGELCSEDWGGERRGAGDGTQGARGAACAVRERRVRRYVRLASLARSFAQLLPFSGFQLLLIRSIPPPLRLLI
eukprot:1530218-Pleurochrysis_carterae.AAC.1